MQSDTPRYTRRPLLDFRIDWGYQFLYSRRQYHPEYRWDGQITCTSGTIRAVYQLEYPYVWWGIPYSPRERLLPDCTWQSTTRRAMAGIRVEAECEADAEFTLQTAQGTFRFTAGEILRTGRIVFPVGAKYSHCTVIVTRTGYWWFQPEPRPDEVVVPAHRMRGADVLSWSRMEQAWIEPGASASFDVKLAKPPRDGESYWLLHLQAMTSRDRSDPYLMAHDFMPMELRAGDQVLARVRRFFRYHDQAVQILHDAWTEIPTSLLPPGSHTLELVNCHQQLPLLVHRLTLRPVTRRHLEITSPRWTLVGHEYRLQVRLLHQVTQLRFTADPDAIRLEESPAAFADLPSGVHEFRFIPLQPLRNIRILVDDCTGAQPGECLIETIYQLPAQTPELKVGYDMTTVPHDESGVMDWLLEYTWRTQLGNLVCFRPFPMGWPVDPKLLERWGNYCREHRVHVQGINLDAGPLPAAAGEYFHAIGAHELSGAVYFKDPDNQSRDMKHAAERYIAFVRERVESTRATAPRVAFGDASGGHRYSLLAGADFLRAETMVAHTMQHLSQARAAAQSLGKGEWGVHIAIQHAKQPYLESHLSQYYLSLMQAWMMGASFLYEEDSLFVLFKEERQGWDDRLTKGKRDMTRAFYRWAATHPTPGRPAVAIGSLLGRYAAPFNGFICGSEQDPDYSVWGLFGRSDNPAWGHRQPEKGQQLLDALMPGASTHPLRQRYDRRRFFFSGTPYGDFDQVPVEAESGFLSRYRLLLHLGWNTMMEEDYQKLLQFARNGGTLLLGVPQLSTHTTRGFLETMEDLALFRDGDVSDLCGVKIGGRGSRFGGEWTVDGNDLELTPPAELARWPSESPGEDGPCHLAQVELRGARVAVRDRATGEPLLVEHRVGAGRVYLLTAWSYPGHEELGSFAHALVAALAREHRGDYFVEDPAGEVFWTWWANAEHPGCGTLMLLNTDWTEPGNQKQVTIHTPQVAFETSVAEGEALLITCLPFGALLPEAPEPHVEILEAGTAHVRLRIHTTGTHSFRLCPGADFTVRCTNTTSQLVELRREGDTIRVAE